MTEKTINPQRLEKIQALRAKGQQSLRHERRSTVSGGAKAATDPYVSAYYWEASIDNANNLSVQAELVTGSGNFETVSVLIMSGSTVSAAATTTYPNSSVSELFAAATVNGPSNPGMVPSILTGFVNMDGEMTPFYLYQVLPVSSGNAAQKAAAGK